jgi:hypothetical protein
MNHLSKQLYYLELDIHHSCASEALPTHGFSSITVTDLYISESHQSTVCKIIACDGAIPLLQVLKLCIVNWDNIDIVDDTPLLLPTRLVSMDLNLLSLNKFLHWIHVAALSILTLALFFPFNCMDSMAPDDYAAVGKYITSLSVHL